MVKIVYLGSSWFSSILLENILRLKNVHVLAVVTSKPAPVGRKKIIKPTLVEEVAHRYDIPVFYSALEVEKELKSSDFALVFAVREFIKSQLLTLPRLGFFNFHPSDLPYYRGPAPVAFSISMGEEKTAMSLIKLDEKLDHGPIVFKKEVKILPDDTKVGLLEKLTTAASELATRLIQKVENNKQIEFKPQNHFLATYTRRLVRDDGFIPYNTLIKAIKGEELEESELPALPREYAIEYKERHVTARRYLQNKDSAKVVYDLFRGLQRWPGIWTKVKYNGAEKRLKLLEMKKVGKKIILKTVQLEGKLPVPASVLMSQILNQSPA